MLPVLLTAVLVGGDRLADRLRGAVIPSAVRPLQLLLLSCIAVWSHPVLDTLNVYGVRWLMPFAERWFYGDVLFIVDPWLILILGTGVWMSRRRGRSRELFRTAQEWPARVALGGSAAYVIIMALLASSGARIARREVASLTGEPPTRIMVSPVPANPFARRVVAEQRNGYLVASFRWLRSPHLDPSTVRTFPHGPWEAPAVLAAALDTDVQDWLSWARFPVVRVDSGAGGREVHFIDVRYAEGPGARIGSTSVTLPAAAAAR